MKYVEDVSAVYGSRARQMTYLVEIAQMGFVRSLRVSCETNGQIAAQRKRFCGTPENEIEDHLVLSKLASNEGFCHSAMLMFRASKSNTSWQPANVG